MKRDLLYLCVTGALFAALAVVFTTLPRSTYSELEKRDLARFPDCTAGALRDGSFTRDIAAWFSDSEPYRDRFMALSMAVKDRLRLSRGDDNVSLHLDVPPMEQAALPSEQTGQEAAGNAADGRDIAEVEAVGADAPAKMASQGIIVAGEAPTARAMVVYGGDAEGGRAWAEAANLYKRTLGPGVKVYAMVIPTAIEYYCPDKVRSHTRKQLPTIRHIYSLLSDSVTAVDVYTTLGHHAKEPVYLRTDHHWSPLGAYYAAGELAAAAGVPYAGLDAYTRKVNSGFVGSMYGYSKDMAVKKSPEDFVYYVPRDSAYTTTFTEYTLDGNFHVTGMGKPHRGRYFYPSKGAYSYSMFMGGDSKITKVETSVRNGRRLLIVKDSFGNALPSFLFGSFEQIHVIDHRYFTLNLADYVRDNGITDLALVNNIFNAYSTSVPRALRRILTQPSRTSGFTAPAPSQSPE